MPILTVRPYAEDRSEDEIRHITFTQGQSVRDILKTTDVRVRTGCRGNGACGLCRISVESGRVDEPTENERIHLNDEQCEQGIRLACQVIPKSDFRIIILNAARESKWRAIPGIGAHDFLSGSKIRVDIPSLKPFLQEVKHPYGIALDLGTTSICLSLFELDTGNRLTTRYGLNPQIISGADVLTRLSNASESPRHYKDMQRLLLEGVRDALSDISKQEGICLRHVTHVTIVGNTAILALLSGRNFKCLLQPEYWMSPIDCLPTETDRFARIWEIHPQAHIDVIPPIAGFVGADLLAGIVALDLTAGEPGSLLVDFGTNTEIALWDGEVLWVTSAAGGPAFEGSGISCGMPAEPGAIDRIVLLENGDLELSVIAGGKPLGICGTGLVDLISGLLLSKKLTRLGTFAKDVPQSGFALMKHGRRLVLTKKDIDLIQQAKAAVGTGISAILNNAGSQCNGLRRIYVGGAFGCFLNVGNAQHIGLLPRIDPKKIELCGNTALAGCEHILLSAKAADHVMRIRERIRIVNLSQYEGFDDLFFQNLYLEPHSS